MVENRSDFPICAVLYPTNVSSVGAASSLTNWMSLPDVTVQRLSAKNGGKPYCIIKRSFSISKVLELNLSGVDPISTSKIFTLISTSPTYTANIAAIVGTTDEGPGYLDYVIRVKLDFDAEMAGRV